MRFGFGFACLFFGFQFWWLRSHRIPFAHTTLKPIPTNSFFGRFWDTEKKCLGFIATLEKKGVDIFTQISTLSGNQKI